MKIIKYNKLIRDKIPQIIKQHKAVPKISQLSQRAFVQELKKKLIEESSELKKAKSKKEFLNELADVLEVLRTLARVKKLSWRAVETKRKFKNKERGGFSKGLFLKEVREQS
ncbi:hypothetical protein A3H10_00940 [Candidatus Uhrbacteria bacterium RIFCSPLOWO2_12_FULL_46_10]|uniref:Phosphoribosyl-ATP pyrophosphohydrolase n=1 Tax=Candidatus Uhrbacteria bacterium RIFCSPLOWO2_01_FULL_47_25 TaxID=1802402 RepID=A0A1F7UTQ7_9BACT|nr:MAG: hypothetical protein UX68_C0010G0061 [Parcubacteria group bacterium GW2011_GWA2_46_9]OGL59271.1 MAG: hypothetical protein A2752_01205 [Candidatus Uhrbacteria bacterium RIFCSPHIGHO2_01_FULL_46_23]OGL68484.1 MAG: hypothetical protein A3D60_02610 [Candidatus Uhrbacteria bacterium RIFCSPHIGHO2_02_FULL_47_29]OGL75589.1 MAG: hypothetical protein A3E96_00925 [Candidatus Uhrbacteria bacterium RIFCSPHIGHO2_12_FULL_46_13]OGL81104.1 MAG: hypothetical protein A2936_00690 [Candidatus Uhrbacteria bac